MADQTNTSTSTGKKNSIVSLLTEGNNKWIAIGIIAVIVIVAVLYFFGPLGGKVAATVNGKKIYLSEVDNQYDAYVKQFQQNNQQKPNKEQEKNIKSMILDRLIKDEVIKQAAEKEGVEVSKKDVDKGVKQIKDSTSPEALKKGLEQMGWTEADLADHVENQLVQTKLREKKTKGIKVTPADAEKYYDQNKINYKVPDQVNIQIAKVTSKGDADKVAAEGKSDFDKAAKKYAKSGYQAQLLSKDQLTGIYSKELAAAAFNASAGQVTSVFKVQGGYAVGKVKGKQAAKQRTYKEVKQEILTMLKSQKEQEAFDKFIEDFKKKQDIKILIDDLKPQQQQMPPATSTPQKGGKK